MPPFEPLNDLEQELVRCQQGHIDLPLFLQVLLASQIYVLLDREITETNPHLTAPPLMLTSPAGYPVFALFTSADRATSLAQRFPTFSYGLLVDARWLLSVLASTAGLVLNPGWSAGLEMPPERFARLKRDFGLMPAG
jgi:hypothetical protein